MAVKCWIESSNREVYNSGTKPETIKYKLSGIFKT